MASVAVFQRPLRGSRISTFYPVKNLPSLSSLDSAFQLQEYISLLIRLDVHDVERIIAIPGKTDGKDQPGEVNEAENDSDKERKSNEVAVDESCWIYEQLRRLAQDLTHPLITTLQQECNRSTCPEMKAGEWLYICVAHGEDGAREQCCAIDYILHTLDSATALLNSPRAFPSRLSIPQTSQRHFPSLARRLGRIFAHAFFHHREAFEQAEAESSLYARFLALTTKYDLVPADFLVIPSRVTSYDGRGEDRRDIDVQPPRLLAAAVDPQAGRSGDAQQSQDKPDNEEGQPSNFTGRSPPGLGPEPGRDSPRRFGRNRTDTMVFSEAASVAEESAKPNEEREAQPVEAGSPEPEPESQQDSSPIESELLNAPEIPTILDEDVQPSDTTAPERQLDASEKPESPVPVSTTAEASPPIPEPTVEQPRSDAPETLPSEVEQEQSTQEIAGTREDEESPLADVPLDAKIESIIEQSVEPAEVTDGDDFVPVDLGKEEAHTAAEIGQEEIVEVPLATPDIVEEVPTDAEAHVPIDSAAVELPSTEKPAQDVEEKAKSEDPKPDVVELPPAATPEGAEGEGGAETDVQPAEEEKEAEPV